MTAALDSRDRLILLTLAANDHVGLQRLAALTGLDIDAAELVAMAQRGLISILSDFGAPPTYLLPAHILDELEAEQ